MLFNSVSFLLFFPTVLVLHAGCPPRFRWALLLAASYFFYACAIPRYLCVLLLLTLIDYFAGLQIGRLPDGARRKATLIVSLLANLGLLFTFKYLDFFAQTVNQLAAMLSVPAELPLLRVVLPLGISFHTFQSLSYTIDVYRRKVEPERHLGRYALFVAFFPQLVAGPIERATGLLPQFRREPKLTYERALAGLSLMVWGLFKKVVIADHLAKLVNTAFHDPANNDLSLLAATYAFTIQIYCDFSGYTDVARGAARVLGYELAENFRQPYLSQSVAEFWRRWHISLSSWFRDYLYIPLGGGRVSLPRRYFNVAVVFLLSGLWHGANWTFLIWGALHGMYLIGEDILGRFFPRKNNPRSISGLLRVVTTFHLVAFGWIFFRADSLSEAKYIVRHLFDSKRQTLGLSEFEFIYIGLAILLMMGVENAWSFMRSERREGTPTANLRWAACYATTLAILLFGEFGGRVFIYFQF